MIVAEDEPTAQDISAMDEAERGQWFYDNREQIAIDSTRTALDRVVSVRVSPDDLGVLVAAAEAVGMKLSAWLRKVGLEAAATASSSPPAAVLTGSETRQLQDSVHNIVALLARSGIRLDEPPGGSARSLVLKPPHRGRKKKAKVEK
ncbi:hypothetical protein Acor_66590 [Acrocarpospora corrugata]|uniref:Uncharacterized protein n=1 Tax=Acrocarpospora corrugata TaxID=35763 RepID=A0A5M3WBZ5_9ACTN|nr:hypothetical protein [Acrocarpospora corrugata]GES04591.1 hypothetical protein Acor_66590 [Acrocarpospora corrugata]